MTLCLTCNGSGRIYAGKLHGRPKYRTCPRCHGIGEHEKEITRKPKEDRGRTGAELQAYCPKCAKPVVLEKVKLEVSQKINKVINDPSPQAQLVVRNNLAIIEHLGAAEALQRSSGIVLDALRKNEGPAGTPRIGEK